MPGIFHSPLARRSFLRTSVLGTAAVVAGCRSTRSTSPAGDEFPLALLSDTHIPADPANGHRGFKPIDNLQRVLRDVVAARPSGVIINGDAARLEGKPEDYAMLKTLLEPAAAVAPVFIGLGNHDNR